MGLFTNGRRLTRRLLISPNIYAIHKKKKKESLIRGRILLGYIPMKRGNLISSQRLYRRGAELRFLSRARRAAFPTDRLKKLRGACPRAPVLLYPTAHNEDSDEMPLTEIIFTYYGFGERAKVLKRCSAASLTTSKYPPCAYRRLTFE